MFDKELVDILASAEKVWIQTHFNHPREITPEVARICKTLLRAGMPLNNHSVLLRGVNDDLEDASVHRNRLENFVDWLGRVESAAVPGFGSGNELTSVSTPETDRAVPSRLTCQVSGPEGSE